MADQSPTSLSVPPTVWIALAFSLAGLFAFNQRPLQDSRPADRPAPVYRHALSEDQDVEARLWEDPLTAVAAAREVNDRNSDGAATAGAALTASAPARQGVPSRASPPCTGECPGAVQTSGVSLHSTARLSNTVMEYASRGESVLVLGALMPGAPYAEDIETRRRIRYAVLAGLHRTAYAPLDSEHIGYVTLSEFYPANLRAHDVAAYEWFQPDDAGAASSRASHVLVLWLDQDGFRDAPLERFSRIVNTIVSGNPCAADAIPSVSAAILGPADSEGLRDMSDELRGGASEQCGQGNAALRKISIYSAAATASDNWVLGDGPARACPDTPIETLADYFECWSSHRVHLHRGVASDLQVAQALLQELEYRGVHDPSEIALVAERDSLYARLMGAYFGGCENLPLTTPDPVDPSNAQKPHPLCFTYLRGLDGLAPPGADTTASSPAPRAGERPAATGSGDPPAASERAAGQGQLDYLRRLASALASKVDQPGCTAGGAAPKSDGEVPKAVPCFRHRIKAIGVMGSDVYDKLLVLQALRSQIPHAKFFTTDLDARLLEPQSLQWTHQLLVGSSLGLALREHLQGDIPPFRDGYQSAAFFSTMLAVRRFLKPEADDQVASALYWTQRPRIFEIGRNQPFDLSADADAHAPCDLDGECRSIAAVRAAGFWTRSPFSSSSVEIAAVTIALLIVIAWTALGTQWVLEILGLRSPVLPDTLLLTRRIVTLSVLALIAIATIWAWPFVVGEVTNGGTRMPAPLLGGTSRWAGSFIELLSIFGVAALVMRGQRKLDQNAEQMRVDFGFPRSREQMVESRRRQLASFTGQARRKELLWFPVLRASRDWRSSSGRSRGTSSEVSEAEVLIAQYLHRGTARARLLRVTIATALSAVLFLFLEIALRTSLIGGTGLLDENSFERRLDSGISLACLLSMVFLIFWIADAMLLTRSFMIAWLCQDPKWPERTLEREADDLGLSDDLAAISLNLRLISQRTAWVANLIWYPSLIIAAMTVAALTVEFGEFGFASNPVALAISAALVIAAAVLLRQAAELWRRAVQRRLGDQRLRLLGRSHSDPRLSEQLDRFTERVNNLSDGAFAPFTGQPLMRAVLLPLLTYGATVALQYFGISSSG